MASGDAAATRRRRQSAWPVAAAACTALPMETISPSISVVRRCTLAPFESRVRTLCLLPACAAACRGVRSWSSSMSRTTTENTTTNHYTMLLQVQSFALGGRRGADVHRFVLPWRAACCILCPRPLSAAVYPSPDSIKMFGDVETAPDASGAGMQCHRRG